MFVIRNKKNIKQILAWGYTLKKGGLGEYDPAVFEEVEVDVLPADYELYKEPPIATGSDLINFINEQTASLTENIAYDLINRLVPVERYLSQPRCNTLNKERYDTALSKMNALLSATTWASVRTGLTQALSVYEKTRRFNK